MRRVVEPELLDSLPPDDPDAIRSRRDLRRVNAWMRNEKHVLKAMAQLPAPPRTIVEIGAGEGVFMLPIAEHFRHEWKHPVQLTLLDMHPVVSPETLNSFAALGWKAEVLKVNLLDWLRNPSQPSVDLIVANLFLHHFSDSELRFCLEKIQARTRAFIACEPRRWLPARIATRFLWLIGCNRVTRHDAPVSVRAGFRDRELTGLWPAAFRAQVVEYPAGFSSHLFLMQRAPKA